jgi:hypothetical protein
VRFKRFSSGWFKESGGRQGCLVQLAHALLELF